VCAGVVGRESIMMTSGTKGCNTTDSGGESNGINGGGDSNGINGGGMEPKTKLSGKMLEEEGNRGGESNSMKGGGNIVSESTWHEGSNGGVSNMFLGT